MKLTVVVPEVPFPANHGGKVDVWRRILALSNEGVQLQLITWKPSDDVINLDSMAELKKHFDSLIVLEIKSSLSFKIFRLFWLFFFPYPVARRMVSAGAFEKIAASVKKFEPDAILQENLYGGLLADQISSQIGVPLFSRSHNIEHLYLRRQLESAKGLRSRISFFIASLHSEKFEKKILARSRMFFDISLLDLSFWKNLGYKNGSWLPPYIEFRAADHSGDLFEVGYVGNLYTPNNVVGVSWFVKNVLPLLPGCRFIIGGANPCSEILDLVDGHPDVQLHKNIRSPYDIYDRTRVLVNPIFTGSGVNIKSIEMLASGLPVVTMPQGVIGFPEDVVAEFCVVEDAESFAFSIRNALNSNWNSFDKRKSVVEKNFGADSIRGFVGLMRR